MSKILAAVGGSGQEIALACLRLNHMAGSEIPLTFVFDSDTVDAKKSAPSRSSNLASLGRLFETYTKRDPVKTVAPIDRESFTDNVGSLFSPNNARLGEVQSLLDLLITREQQQVQIIDGFHGQPTVGAIAVADAIAVGKIQDFMETLEQATARSTENHYIVIAGGTAGGTGPGVIPVLARAIAQWRKGLPEERQRRIALSLVVQLPWFQIVDRQSGDIDVPSMDRNSACLVKLYFDEVGTVADRVALLGLPKMIGRKSDGAFGQRETLHYLNVISGYVAGELLCASSFVTDQMKDQGVYAFSLEDSEDQLDELKITTGNGGASLRKAIDTTALNIAFGTELLRQLEYPREPALPQEIWAIADKWRNNLPNFRKKLGDLVAGDRAILDWFKACCAAVGDDGARDPQDLAKLFLLTKGAADEGFASEAAKSAKLPPEGQNFVASLLRRSSKNTQSRKALDAEDDAVRVYASIRKTQLEANSNTGTK